MENLEQRIRNIEERNSAVEADKSWETSWTRRCLLTALTYIAVGLYLSVIGVAHPWIQAIVPAGGFMISTLTAPLVKNVWIRKVYSNKKKR